MPSPILDIYRKPIFDRIDKACWGISQKITRIRHAEHMFRRVVFGVKNVAHPIPREAFDAFFSNKSYENKNRLAYAASRLVLLPEHIRIRATSHSVVPGEPLLDMDKFGKPYPVLVSLDDVVTSMARWSKIWTRRHKQPYVHHLDALSQLPWADIARMAYLYGHENQYKAIVGALVDHLTLILTVSHPYQYYSTIIEKAEAVVAFIEGLTHAISASDLKHLNAKGIERSQFESNRLGLARRGIPRLSWEVSPWPTTSNIAQASEEIATQCNALSDVSTLINVQRANTGKAATAAMRREAVLQLLSKPEFSPDMLAVYAIADSTEITLQTESVKIAIPYKYLNSVEKVGVCVKTLANYVFAAHGGSEGRTPTSILKHATGMLLAFPALRTAKRFVDLDRQLQALLGSSIFRAVDVKRGITFSFNKPVVFRMNLAQSDFALRIEVNTPMSYGFARTIYTLIHMLAEALGMPKTDPVIQDSLQCLLDIHDSDRNDSALGGIEPNDALCEIRKAYRHHDHLVRFIDQLN